MTTIECFEVDLSSDRDAMEDAIASVRARQNSPTNNTKSVRISNVRLRWRDLQQQFFSGLSTAFPLLEHFHLSNCYMEMNSVAAMIRQTSNTIRSLKFTEVWMRSPNDVVDLSRSLRNLPNLEHFHMAESGSYSNTGIEALLNILRELTTCERLTTIYFHSTDRSATSFGLALEGLCTKPNLQEITLIGCGINGAGMALAFDALQTYEDTTSLEHLEVRNDFVHPNTEGSYQTQTSIESLANVLRGRSTALKTLRIHAGETDLRPIAEALKINRTLQCLQLNLPRPTYRYTGPTQPVAEEVSAAFVAMLEDNYVLKELFLECSNPTHSSILQLYLDLNQFREHLLSAEESAAAANNHQDWIDAMIALSDDVRAIFYLLSKMPSLCQRALSAATVEEESQRRPKKRPKLVPTL